MAGILSMLGAAAAKAAPMLVDYGINLLGQQSANRQAKANYNNRKAMINASNQAGIDSTSQLRSDMMDQWMAGIQYYKDMVPAVARGIGKVYSREQERQSQMIGEFLQAQQDLRLELVQNAGRFAAGQSGSGMLNNAVQVAAKMELVPNLLNQIPLQKQLSTNIANSDEIAANAWQKGQDQLNALWHQVKDRPTLPTFQMTQMPKFTAPHDIGSNWPLKIGGIAMKAGLGALLEKAPSIAGKGKSTKQITEQINSSFYNKLDSVDFASITRRSFNLNG